jgi:hypothetical protein
VTRSQESETALGRQRASLRRGKAIQYEFKLELDKQMTIGSFQSK